jgi:hypothetical protein
MKVPGFGAGAEATLLLPFQSALFLSTACLKKDRYYTFVNFSLG